MTLTLEIPPDLNTDRRKSLAAALFEAGLINERQAAALVMPQTAALRQGSPEWKALLHRNGPAPGVILSPEATSREAIYNEDLP